MRRHAKATVAGSAMLLCFLVLPAVAAAEPPTLTIGPVTEAETTKAHVSGNVDFHGSSGEWWFETSTNGTDWIRSNVSGFAEGAEAVAGTLEGLSGGVSTYEVRLSGWNFEEFNQQLSGSESFETDPAPVAPAAAVKPATSVAYTSAQIQGSLDPEGGNEEESGAYVSIHWALQLSPSGEPESFGTVAEGTLATGEGAESSEPVDVPASPAEVSGLTPNHTYTYRLLATYAGQSVESASETFTTEAVKPDTERETLWDPTSTSIQLNAKVNAHNSVLTDCHFEYGTTTAYGGTAPCEALFSGDTYVAPEDNSDHVVAARIAGLTPFTEYHFRLVATNAAGEAQGDDRSFTTLGELATESCSNQSIRDAQHSTQLPDCRAFEKVSPADKGHGDIVGDGATTVAAQAGDAVAFNSRTPFGDTIGSGTVGQTQYVARRTDQAWAVHGITPTGRPDAKQTFFAPTLLQIYSNDLRTAVVRGYDLPAATDDAPLRNSIYVEDTATLALRTVSVSQVDVPSPFDFVQYPQDFWGISADARHVVFVSVPDFFGVITQFLPDAAPGVPNVYQWDEGVLSLAGILPDGTVPLGGSESPMNYRGAMSADGSRLLFTASTGGNPQLYLRIDGSRTVWVSETELEPSDPNYNPDPGNVQAKGMTPDGQNVFFTTDTPLLPGDANGGTDLYRWTDTPDPANESNLTLISQSGDLGGADLIGISDDGERVYYRTTGNSLVVWDDGASSVISNSLSSGGLSLLAAKPGYGRVTPDGMFLAFATNATVDGFHDLTGGILTNNHREMYLYSLADDTLTCVSCPSAPAMSDATVLPAVTQGEPSLGNAGIRPRFLSDGGRVFFSTAEALVPQDTNGVLDTYEYDPATGQVSLLSSGRGKDPSTFTDSSASGDDVFIVTRQRLVPSDRDELVDLYDIRVGGGLPEPEESTSPPCEGDDCQPAPSATPATSRIGSSLAGAGNLNRRVHCSKRKRRVRRHGKVRCLPKQHRRANDNRRAGR